MLKDESVFVLHEIFPTTVGKISLSDSLIETIISKWGEEKGHTIPNVKNYTGVNNYFLDNPKLLHIKEYLEVLLTSYLHEIYRPYSKDIEIYITQSWINIAQKGQGHHEHYHPNSILSAVIFLDIDKGDCTTFIKERDHLSLRLIPEEYTLGNSSSWKVGDVNTNDMLVFPSQLSHEAQSVKSSRERITLAFNTFISGTVGDSTQLSELKLTKPSS
jgi:uncharacterized protein (TIGR02466 family)